MSNPLLPCVLTGGDMAAELCAKACSGGAPASIPKPNRRAVLPMANYVEITKQPKPLRRVVFPTTCKT